MSADINRIGSEAPIPPRVVPPRKKGADEHSFEQELEDHNHGKPRKPARSEDPAPDKPKKRGSDGETGTHVDVTA